jgi:selenide,water dikinase
VSALQRGAEEGSIAASDYEAMVATTTQLNTPGPMLACLDGVHAVTDVTGFGLAGHLLEVCKGSGLRATVNYADLPLLARAGEFVEAGLMTGASGRNWASYGDRVSWPPASTVPRRPCSPIRRPRGPARLLCAGYGH